MSDLERIKDLFTKSLPLFSALGDPARQQLLLFMMDGQRRSVAELAAKMELSRPTVSHHLKILKDAHILAEEKEGTKTYYFPQMGEYFQPIKELVETVERIEKGGC